MKINEQNKKIAIQMISNDDFEFTAKQVAMIVSYEPPKDIETETNRNGETDMFSNMHIGGFSIELPDPVSNDVTIEEQMTIDDFKGKRKFSERKNRNDERKSYGYEYSTGGTIAMLRKTFYKITQSQLAKEFSKMNGNKCTQKDISDIELNNEKALNKFKNEISLYIGKGEERA